MSEINENVLNIEIICYLRKSDPAFRLFFIVSNQFFLHTEQLLKANITELDSNWNSRHNLCSSHTFVQFTSAYFQGFHILHNPDTSCSIIFKTLAYPDSNQSFPRHWHIHTPINHLQDLGLSRLWSIVCKILAYLDCDQLFTRFGHIRTSINHLQDFGITVFWLIIHKTLINHWQDWHMQLIMGICSNMSKSCEWLIRVLICPSLVNNLLESRYAKVSWMIDLNLDKSKSCEWLIVS